MLEQIFGHDGKLTIHQCESLAKHARTNNHKSVMTFDLCGPLGRKKCQWLDPSFGFFTIEGAEGFVRTADVAFANVWCENVMIQESPTNP